MNRDDVIDVLTAVSAADRRTVGDADVDVWLAVIGDLPVDKALRAVRDHFRNKPGVWIEPGHVYQGARAIIRDELDRNPEAAYEANASRGEILAGTVVETFGALRAGKDIPPEREFVRQPPAKHLGVRCPWCRAAVGKPCVVPGLGGRPHGGVHPSRIELATTGRVEK